MGSVKKVLWVGLTGVSGLLLTLAGLQLIDLSETLILYSGVTLLVTAALMYFFS